MSKYKTEAYREWHASHARKWRKSNGKRNYALQKRWKTNNLEKYRAIQANSSLKKNYGITTQQRDEMFISQGACCAICKAASSGRKGHAWAVDHCHTTGRIRGILCHQCNAMLGYAKDNPKTLAAAIRYLMDRLEMEVVEIIIPPFPQSTDK